MLRERLGHYTIREVIGRGGMGVVYRAVDRRLRREVAVKVLADRLAGDPERLKHLETEARVLASLNHPNIAAIYGLEEAEGAQALVMEYVDGTTLAEMIRSGPVPHDELVRLARQMCEALAAAHERGVIHRDVKPSNVKITSDGRVKLLDFGLASPGEELAWLAEASDDPEETRLVLPAVVGTVPYMAPEQLRRETVDSRTDVYALGVVLYEMATGQRPFAAETGNALVRSILYEAPVSPRHHVPGLSPRLEQCILRCLEKRPEGRFASMRELSAELRASSSSLAAAAKSVAVLPFDNVGGSPEDQFFCDGITEDILVELARIQGLSVLSRSTLHARRDRSVPAGEIGRRLGAGYVLDGSVRCSPERLRIAAQLLDARTGTSVWAERYDRQREDVFAIQAEIAENIARTLRVVLTGKRKRGIEKVPTTNVDAYELYLKARHGFRQFRRKSIEFACRLLERAIAIDPDYAMAHAAFADCHSYLFMFWEASDAHRLAAESASRRAVELDPELAEAYSARGVAVSLQQRYEDADRDFESAIRLDPTLFEAHYFRARGNYARGRLEEAVTWFERARQTRPEDYQAPILEASALAGLGREEESRAAYREGLERAERHLELDPGDTRALYFGAIALCRVGETERCSEWAERALAMDPTEPQVLYNVGCVYALLGRPDEALDCLAATLAHGGWWRTWMRNDPDLASLTDHPRFRELVDPPT